VVGNQRKGGEDGREKGTTVLRSIPQSTSLARGHCSYAMQILDLRMNSADTRASM
jgi:hypothetical protein